jgi:hypothetical protein
MGVKEECLGPGVKDGDRTGNGTEAALGDGVKCPDCGLKEERIACASIRQKKGVEGGGDRKDQVEVGHRKELSVLRFDPACLFQTLALRAMAVPARVVERLLPSTLVAHLEVSAQKRRSTCNHVSDHSTTFPPELLGGRRMCPEDLCQVW